MYCYYFWLRPPSQRKELVKDCFFFSFLSSSTLCELPIQYISAVFILLSSSEDRTRAAPPEQTHTKPPAVLLLRHPDPKIHPSIGTFPFLSSSSTTTTLPPLRPNESVGTHFSLRANRAFVRAFALGLGRRDLAAKTEELSSPQQPLPNSIIHVHVEGGRGEGGLRRRQTRCSVWREWGEGGTRLPQCHGTHKLFGFESGRRRRRHGRNSGEKGVGGMRKDLKEDESHFSLPLASFTSASRMLRILSHFPLFFFSVSIPPPFLPPPLHERMPPCLLSFFLLPSF